MKYGDKDLQNAVIIGGKLYEVKLANIHYCKDCDLPFHTGCWNLCQYFDKDNSYAVFKHIETSQILNLKENETTR